jgi:hypothetical protein
MPCCVSEPTSKPVQPQEDISYATRPDFKSCADYATESDGSSADGAA